MFVGILLGIGVIILPIGILGDLTIGIIITGIIIIGILIITDTIAIAAIIVLHCIKTIITIETAPPLLPLEIIEVLENTITLIQDLKQEKTVLQQLHAEIKIAHAQHFLQQEIQAQ